MQVGVAEDKSQRAGTPSPSLSVRGEAASLLSMSGAPPGLQLAQEGGELLGTPRPGLDHPLLPWSLPSGKELVSVTHILV